MAARKRRPTKKMLRLAVAIEHLDMLLTYKMTNDEIVTTTREVIAEYITGHHQLHVQRQLLDYALDAELRRDRERTKERTK